MNEATTNQSAVRPYDLFILVLTILSLFTSTQLYLPFTDFQANRILVTLDWVYSGILEERSSKE